MHKNVVLTDAKELKKKLLFHTYITSWRTHGR